MGCCLSVFNSDSNKNKNTIDGRCSSKRSFFSHISNVSSSGVFSDCNSPSRPSVLSSCNSSPSSQQPRARRTKFHRLKLNYKNSSTGLKMLSICDDFGEAGKMKQHPENISFGYYSDSMSTPSQSSLRRTLDASLSPELPLVPAADITSNDLEMEMYMISLAQGLMPKTSSPIFQRKHIIFDADATGSQTSHSYSTWANYLQSTPTYMIHNITNIPEAIAGHFSPLDFPAFTGFGEIGSAAKRYTSKADIHFSSEIGFITTMFPQQPISKPSNKARTIITDL